MGLLDNFRKNWGAKKYTGIIAGGLPAGTRWGDMSFLKANDVSLYTNRAISRRAQKVGEIDFVVLDAKGAVIENDPILKVLNRPNKHFSKYDFWALNQTYIDVVGDSYVWMETNRKDAFSAKTITAMHILRPDLVKAVYVKGMLLHYEYSTPDGTVNYDADEVVHFYRPDPLNPLKGVSLLKAGIHAIQTEQQIGAYHARILENGGKIEGVMKFTTERLQPEQLQELKDGYEKEYADARNAGRPLFVGGDAAYQNLGLTPHEMAFMDAKKMTLEDIVIMTAVPKILLGSVDDVQFSNSDASMRMFLRETINPLLKALTSALTHKLTDDTKTISFIDPTPENIDEKLKQIASGVTNHYLTVNEAREMSELGLEPIEGGDTIMVPFNLLPLGKERFTTPAPGTDEKKLKSTIEHPLLDVDVRSMWADISVKRADAREEIFIKHLDNYFKEQMGRFVAAVSIDQKRVFRIKNLFDEVANATLEIRLGHSTLYPVLAEMAEAAGNDSMRLAGSTYGFNMTSDVTGWIDARTNVFMEKITATTFEKLKSEFQASFDAGESRPELVARIENTYGEITEWRSNLIARTEVHIASQYANMEGYKQAGLNIKIWVAVGDIHTRDSHYIMDGQERPIGMPFSNGLMFPGDPTGSAGEVINCRCTM